MHKHGVAHRYVHDRNTGRLFSTSDIPSSDCEQRNILMDAPALYPEGFHPVRLNASRDFRNRTLRNVPRAFAPARYYYVDFGISVHIPPEVRPKCATGVLGRDREVPELSQPEYDPFKVDIFVLGNLFRKVICEVSILRLWSRHSEDRQCCRNSPTLTSFGHWPNQ